MNSRRKTSRAVINRTIIDGKTDMTESPRRTPGCLIVKEVTRLISDDLFKIAHRALLPR
jgi:hypothetical protein